jgi:hypothetical protein
VTRSRPPEVAAYIDGCRDNDAVRLVYLARAGNSALASDKFIRHLSLSPNCRLCNEEEEETFTHLVLHCESEQAGDIRRAYRALSMHVPGAAAYNPVEVILEHQAFAETLSKGEYSKYRRLRN